VFGQDDCEFDEMVCPITFKIMEDPVIAADGHTYERSAIQEWIERATRGAPS
jgi:SUMO ligase MMS21 Smc5/6 complex component